MVTTLSAEPLVGLKPLTVDCTAPRSDPFSRTPRGFEAVYVDCVEVSQKDFQPNPSWV